MTSFLYVNSKGELCKLSATKDFAYEKIIRGVEDQFFGVGFTFEKTNIKKKPW